MEYDYQEIVDNIEEIEFKNMFPNVVYAIYGTKW